MRIDLLSPSDTLYISTFHSLDSAMVNDVEVIAILVGDCLAFLGVVAVHLTRGNAN